MPSRADPPLNQDFADLLRALSAAKARYLIVGAYALAVHGEPRATGDLDIWVEATARNAARVYQALREFGAPLRDLTEDDLAAPGTVFQIGIAPRRIDVLTSISGVSFGQAWRSRTRARFGNLTVPVLGRAALIRNKLAAARPRDLLDVEELRRGPRR